jgi:hypothetical protein
MDSGLHRFFGVLLVQVATHTLHLLGCNRAHVVLGFGHAHGLKQGDDHLVFQLELLGDLVNAQLDTHKTSIERLTLETAAAGLKTFMACP